MTEVGTTPLLLTEPSPRNGVSEHGCQIHEFTTLILDSTTMLICLFGLVGNGMVLWLLGFVIKKNPFTIYILNLAIADCIFLLCLLIYLMLAMVETVFCLPDTGQPLRLFHLLSFFSHNTSLYLLMVISLERCLSVFYPIWCRCHRPKYLSGLTCALLWALSGLLTGLMTYFCVTRGKACKTSRIAMYVVDFLICAPVMVLTNIILFVKIQRSSQQRQPGKLYIVILLTVVFFLVFAVPFGVKSFGQYFNSVAISIEICYMLASINSGINPVIYFLVGSYRRWQFKGSVKVAFKRVFEEQLEFSQDRASHRSTIIEMSN